MASLVVPVLEQTVERAIALGASMEVRGLAATRRAEPDCERPAGLAGGFARLRGRWALDGLVHDFMPGTLTLVTGATGSGKSTLLNAMSGLFQHVADGEQLGTIEVAGADRVVVPPRENSRLRRGRVPVRAAVVRDGNGGGRTGLRARDEAGSTAHRRGACRGDRRAAEDPAPSRPGDHRAVGGEACLVAIGAAIVERPVLLLVDEPLAELDAAAARASRRRAGSARARRRCLRRGRRALPSRVGYGPGCPARASRRVVPLVRWRGGSGARADTEAPRSRRGAGRGRRAPLRLARRAPRGRRREPDPRAR